MYLLSAAITLLHTKFLALDSEDLINSYLKHIPHSLKLRNTAKMGSVATKDVPTYKLNDGTEIPVVSLSSFIPKEP